MTARHAASLEHAEVATGPILPLRAGAQESHRFSPLVAWLVATARPTLTVEIGPGDETSLTSTCEAVLQCGTGARCAAVLLTDGDAGPGRDGFGVLVEKLTDRFDGAVEVYDDEPSSRKVLEARRPELVHLALFDAGPDQQPDTGAWLRALAPGGLMVITTTAADSSAGYAEAKRTALELYPSVPISLGLTAEAVVVQRPGEAGTPVVDTLQEAPFAVGALVALVGEQLELDHLLHGEPEPSAAVRTLIGRIVEQQFEERDAFLAALRAYKDETDRLSVELAEARAELARQFELARAEREHLVGEFLDRVDHLSSKISTSAARYTALLEEKDQLIEAQERRVEAYAGMAATAQSVIDDIRGSTSWRVTAPLRVLTRALGNGSSGSRARLLRRNAP